MKGRYDVPYAGVDPTDEIVDRLESLADERSASDDVWKAMRDAVTVIRRLNGRCFLVNMERTKAFHTLMDYRDAQGGC